MSPVGTRKTADLGVDTPGMLPCIPVMKNILGESNQSALSNFERAVREVYEHPDESVALAASTLEGLLKTILRESQQGAALKNDSLSRLTGRVVKELIATCDPSAPRKTKLFPRKSEDLGAR